MTLIRKTSKAKNTAAAESTPPMSVAANPTRVLKSRTPAQEPVTPVPMASPAPTEAVPTGTKLARVIEHLRRPEGATVAELMQLTGWLSHSVRGALSGALKRKLGLVTANSLDPVRGRVYRIVNEPELAADPNPSAISEPSSKSRRAKRSSGAAREAAAA